MMDFDTEKTALVMVDIQERLFAAVPELAPMLPKVKMLLRSAAELRLPAVVTEQYPRGLGPTIPELKALLQPGWPVIAKTDFSCWGVEAFRRELAAKKIRTVVLMGIECHVCVQQTAFDLQAQGFDVVLAADTVASRNAYDRQMALELMRSAGIGVTTAEAIVFAWLRTAKHPSFKAISALVK
ncbi:MAG: isochorismatase family protein [Victivallales bacterium]|nr:isochorismatase family protein [Victivallales bacterium]